VSESVRPGCNDKAGEKSGDIHSALKRAFIAGLPTCNNMIISLDSPPHHDRLFSMMLIEEISGFSVVYLTQGNRDILLM